MGLELLSIVTMAAALAAGPNAGEPARPWTERGESGPAVVELPMERYGQRPLVDVKIEGHGPYKFILDTGADGSTVDAALAKELNLRVTGATRLSSPAGGEGVESSNLMIDTLEAGGMIFHDVDAQTLDLRGMFGDPSGPQGILGASNFPGMLLTLDYPGSRILLRPGELPPADGSEIFQYAEEDTFPSVDVSYGGVTVRSHLDTGSPGGFTLPSKFAGKLHLDEEPKKVGEANLVGGTMDLLGAKLIAEAKIGKHAFEEPDLRFGEFFPVGNIGYQVLKDFEVTIDSANKRVRLERTGSAQAAIVAPATAGTAAAPPNRRYGIQLHGIDGESVDVAGAEPGSIAERAGLQAGDKILEMNGKPLAGLSREERIGCLRGSPLVLLVDRGGEKVEIRMALDS